MHSLRRQFCATAAAAFLLVATPAGADVKAGVDAWQAGNYDAAVREWRPLADAGDPDAQFNMGQAYKLGRGVPSDLELAQGWYQKSAQQGHEQAQANLGLILFQNGDRAGAMPWIRKAADHGDPRAQYVLGTALFNGDLVTKDWPRAYALMTRAAAQGLPQAASSLSDMDKYIPLAERERGVAMARELERGAGTALAAAAPSAPPPSSATRPAPKPAAPPTRVASNAPAPTSVPASKPATRPMPAPSAVSASLASPGGKWRVQLGAFGSPAIARSQWTSLSRRIGALSGLQPYYEAHGNFTRLRVGPLANRAAADKLCAAAKASGQACFAVAP